MGKIFRSQKGEDWKAVDLEIPYVKDYILEVSNMGRVRSVTPRFGIRLIKGSELNGYRIIRLKFFKPRTKSEQKTFESYVPAVKELKKNVEWEKENGTQKKYEEILKELELLTLEKEKFAKEDMKNRTIHYHILAHRLVANYFLPKPKKEETVVGHLDYNKTNNKATNLKWMTKEENVEHQQESPYVILAHKKRENRFNPTKNNSKLTRYKVSKIKKLLNEGTSAGELAEKYNVSKNQIYRIKRGDNWRWIKPAK
ncbi:MAG: HNH endonuclease [Moheibacter sp.]